MTTPGASESARQSRASVSSPAPDSPARWSSPHDKNSLLAGPLRLAVSWVLRYPKHVLVLAIVLAVGSIVYTSQGLKFRTSRLDLLNPRSGYNQRWLAYLDEFGDDDDAIVVVEGDDPAAVSAMMDRLAERLVAEPGYFQSVWHRYDLSALRSKGLHYLTTEQLAQLDRGLAQLAPIARGHWNQLNVRERLRWANDHLQAATSAGSHAPPVEWERAAAEVRGLLALLRLTLTTRSEAAAWPAMQELSQISERFPNVPLTTPDGRLGMVLLRFRAGEDGMARGGEALTRLREVVDELAARETDLRLGVTGLPVLENDEMQASQSDMVQASLLSLLGVAVLFVAGFGAVRHPLMTVLTLLLAMAWTFGYVTLAIGHLNLLSVSFGVILIGLGIDFGIHFVARYQQLRTTMDRPIDALRETAGGVGPGILTGGLTTALAFCTAAMTEFTGVAELGLIAGGGILLCVVAALLVLPALLLLSDLRYPTLRQPPTLPVGLLCGIAIRRPRWVLTLTLLGTTGLAAGVANLRFDHNLLNLQPRQLESVELEHRLLERTDRSVWFALSVANSDQELLRRKALFERLPSVQRTEEIVSLLPVADARRRAWIERIGDRLSNRSARIPLIGVPSVDELSREVERSQRLLAGAGDTDLATDPTAVLRHLREQPPRDCLARISQFQQRSAEELAVRLGQLARMADPVPPNQSDLPPPLVARFVGRSSLRLLKVYARGSIWDMDALEQFVRDVERVDPRVTGHPIQTFYASRQMQSSYVHAAVYSLLAVCIVLMLDFRSIRLSLLSLIPLGLGALQLFGILGWLGIPLNPANLIVLPLILGIGIDDGVHVVHDFLQQKGRYRLSNSTATAVLLTSATTMVGFGSMMFARHRGLQSLGQVLTIGVFCCLVSSLLVLPPLLAWLARGRSEGLGDSEVEGCESVGAPSQNLPEMVGLVVASCPTLIDGELTDGQAASQVEESQSRSPAR